MPQRPDPAPSPAAVELAALAVERDLDAAAPDVVIAQRARTRIQACSSRPWMVISERDGRLERVVGTRAQALVRAQDEERRALTTKAMTAAAPDNQAGQAHARIRAARPELFLPYAERMLAARDAALVEATRTHPHLVAHLTGGAPMTGEVARATASPVLSARRNDGFSADLNGRTPLAWAEAFLAHYGVADAHTRENVSLCATDQTYRAMLVERFEKIYAPKPARRAGGAR